MDRSRLPVREMKGAAMASASLPPRFQPGGYCDTNFARQNETQSRPCAGEPAKTFLTFGGVCAAGMYGNALA
eukprot:2818716-Pleurochrysis_carterae.AAC.1